MLEIVYVRPGKVSTPKDTQKKRQVFSKIYIQVLLLMLKKFDFDMGENFLSLFAPLLSQLTVKAQVWAKLIYINLQNHIHRLHYWLVVIGQYTFHLYNKQEIYSILSRKHRLHYIVVDNRHM